MARRRRPPADPESQPFAQGEVPDDYVRLDQPPARPEGTTLDALLGPRAPAGRGLYPGVTEGKRRRAEEQRFGPKT